MPPRQHRIRAHAKSLQYLRWRVRDPPADCQQRSRPGQHRARGQREDDGQGVPHSARIARVRHLGQPLQQAGHLAGADVEMLSELVKGERDRG
ncbi:hypothetical protein GCM10009540_76320 [Streptomyces turgidiscabies]